MSKPPFFRVLQAVLATALVFLLAGESSALSLDSSAEPLHRAARASDIRGALHNLPPPWKTVSYPNGLRTDYSYDARNRLTKVEQRKSADNTLVGSIAYTLSPHNLRTQLVESLTTSSGATASRTEDYGYDKLGRLSTLGFGGMRFDYDAVGNRVFVQEGYATSYTYDRNDRLIQFGGPPGFATFTYDANGNTTQKIDNPASPFPVTTTYQYDAANRLTSATVNPASPIAKLFTFAFDAEGNRISKTLGQTPTPDNIALYVVDKNLAYAQVIEERDGNGALIVSYTYGDGGPISQTRYVNGVATTSYYLADGLGSTRQLANAAGTITDSYFYKPFGEIVSQTGTTQNNYLFAGEQLDPSLGLYYNRARYLNPSIGRFVSMDSHPGNDYRPVTLNDYLYANANPISFTDPSGQFSLGEVGASFNIRGIFTAYNNVSTLADFVYGDDDSDSDRPSLWDALMSIVLGGGSGLANVAFGGVTGGGSSEPPWRGKPNAHHTIPVYLCGKDQPSNLVTIKAGIHSDLHSALDKLPIVIDVAGKTVSLVLKRRKAKSDLQPVLSKYLKKPVNRGALVGALHVFYSYFGFLELKNQAGPGTFGSVFIAEGGRYVQSKANTSLPLCRK